MRGTRTGVPGTSKCRYVETETAYLSEEFIDK